MIIKFGLLYVLLHKSIQRSRSFMDISHETQGFTTATCITLLNPLNLILSDFSKDISRNCSPNFGIGVG